MEFSDYISQNEGVNDGSLDANYYQHLPYLESMIAAKGYKLVPVALGYTSRMAIYSKKHRALAELPDGAAIAYPNDPVNTGHALLILQEAGLITPAGRGHQGHAARRHGQSAQAALSRAGRQHRGARAGRRGRGRHLSGLRRGGRRQPESALYAEKDSSRYAIRWVTRPENARTRAC